jgi:lipopolysaccharide export LptBFGC system permease protein LptF
MARGIMFYVLVWFGVTAALYVFSKMKRHDKLTLYRCIGYGLGTATLALCLVLLVVYLF